MGFTGKLFGGEWEAAIKTEVRGRKSEGGYQRSEVRWLRAEGNFQRSESEIRDQRAETGL